MLKNFFIQPGVFWALYKALFSVKNNKAGTGVKIAKNRLFSTKNWKKVFIGNVKTPPKDTALDEETALVAETAPVTETAPVVETASDTETLFKV